MTGRGKVEETRRTKILALAQELVAQAERGESIDRGALAVQHADLMPELVEEFTRQQMIAEIRRNFEQQQGESGRSAATANLSLSSIDTARLTVRCPHCANSVEILADRPWSDITCVGCGQVFSLVSDHRPTHQAPVLKQIAHFELIERIGVGGFGTVWKARDTILDRVVALKLPRRGQLTETEISKFLREARAAAQLRHPNIVSVHEVGRTDEAVYIVSDLVRGVSLTDWMAIRAPLPRDVAELCFRISNALDHAHETGIVHRDLKPGNIMVDGRNDPHIMDFGLAKRDAGEVTMTVEGQLLGTPAYMAPEQALGQAHECGPPTDVYSLGVIMFELLTGELPFRGNTSMLIHQVINDEPPSPRKLNNHIPIDLETICLRCLEKDPARRFATAGDLALELRRYLDGEPILSRPTSAYVRMIRWVKRHTTVTGMAIAVILVLIAGSSATTYFALRASGFRRQTENLIRQTADQRTEIEERDDEIRKHETKDRQVSRDFSVLFDEGNSIMRGAYNHQLQLASLVRDGEPRRIVELLEDPQRCARTNRDVVWSVLHATHRYGSQRVTVPNFDTCRSLQWATSGESIGLCSQDAAHLLQRDATGRWYLASTHPMAAGTVVAYRPRDLALITAQATDTNGATSTSFAIQLRPGEPSSAWLSSLQLPATLYRCRFSPDSRYLLAYGADATTGQRWVIDTETQQIVATHPLAALPLDGSIGPGADATHPYQLIECAADGQLLVDDEAQSVDERLNGWRLACVTPAGRLLATKDDLLAERRGSDTAGALHLPATEEGIQAVSVDDSFAQLAVATRAGTVLISDLVPQTSTKRFSFPGASSFEFSPNAKMFVTATPDAVQLINLATPAEPRVFPTHDAARSLTWSPSNDQFGFLTSEGVMVVDLLGRQQAAPLELRQTIKCLCFLERDRLLLANDQGDLLSLSLVGHQIETITHYAEPVRSLAYNSNSKIIAVGVGNRIELLHNNGKRIWLRLHKAPIERICMSRAGIVVSVDQQGVVIRWKVNWNSNTSEPTVLQGHDHRPTSVEPAMDGQTMTTVRGNRVMFWDMKSGDYRGCLRLESDALCARLAPFPLEPTTQVAVLDVQGHLDLISGEYWQQPTMYLGGVVRDFAWLGSKPNLVAVGDLANIVEIDSLVRFDHRLAVVDDPIECVAVAKRSDGEHLLVGQLRPGLSPTLIPSAIVSYDVDLETLDVVMQGDPPIRAAAPLRKLCAFDNGQRVLAYDHQQRLRERFLTDPPPATDAAAADGSLIQVGASNEAITDFVLSANEQQLLVGTSAGNLFLLTRNSGAWQAATTAAASAGVTNVTHLFDGRWLVLTQAGELQLWDAALQRKLSQAKAAMAYRLVASGVAPLAATATGSDVQLWDVKGDRLAMRNNVLAEHSGPITAMTFSPDGRSLITASEDRSVKSWSINGKALPASIPANVRDLLRGAAATPAGTSSRPPVPASVQVPPGIPSSNRPTAASAN